MLTKKVAIKRKREVNVFLIITGIVLALFALSLILPLIWGLITSFKSRLDFNQNLFGFPNPALSSEEMKFGNYVLVFRNFEFRVTTNFFQGLALNDNVYVDKVVGLLEILLNTLVYAVGGAIVAAVVPCIVGYLCAKYRFKFSSLIYGIVVFVMVMPIVGAIPARITLLRQLRMFDSLVGSLIEKLSFTNMYFLVFYAFFRGVPDSFSEAAEVDGASQFRVMVSIMLPMSIKMITTVALILFVQYWNDYNTPFLFLPTHPTLAYAVFEIVVRQKVANLDTGYKLFYVPCTLAACMMLAVPIVVIFVAFKDKLMGNMSLGGIKG